MAVISDIVREEVGWCSRLDGVQAAVLEVELRTSWPMDLRQTTACAVRYREGLGDALPWTEGAVHHLLAVRIPGGRRDSVATDLDRAGIDRSPLPSGLCHNNHTDCQVEASNSSRRIGIEGVVVTPHGSANELQ